MMAAPAVGVARALAYTCPRCQGAVEGGASAYVCTSCAARFPVVLGIPDFRIFPDPWIGFVEDRDKAHALEERTRGASLEEMVREYWAMTPGTPAGLASRYVEHVLGAEHRSREWLDALGTPPATRRASWLDVGTGTGDLATVTARQGTPTVGVDIAMRWLVVARRRAEIAGVTVNLVCCNAEHLPFPDGSFARVLSVGTLEHCVDAARVLAESRRVLARGGETHLRTVNRFTVLREPHVGVWGVGYVPRRMADRYVRWRSGQRYLHHRPLSSRELSRSLRSAGFRDVRVEPARLLSSERVRLGPFQWAAGWYERARQSPATRFALRLVSPLLEAHGVAA